MFQNQERFDKCDRASILNDSMWTIGFRLKFRRYFRQFSMEIGNKRKEECSSDIQESVPIPVIPKKRFKREIPVETSLDVSGYYIENGLRKVYPYPFTYYSYCKGRWVNRTIKELFAVEFRALSLESMYSRISKGFLHVNGKPVDADYVLKDNDFITHRIHRHEFPVLAAPIPIIHSDDEFLVIDKPPSLPVHPCGKYRLNTITSLLEKENHFKDLHVVHRLDRLTSGIMILGKTKARAQKLHEEMRNREMHKEYVCRVDGRFPDGILECDQPIETIAHRIGICVVSPNGKPSKTTFERLNYNGKSSTVLCRPHTGRMHQIRVHLQYLGHPIVNDTFYNSDVWGKNRGKNGEYEKTREQLIKDIENTHQIEQYLIYDGEDVAAKNRDRSQDERNDRALKALAHYTSQPIWQEIKKDYQFDPSKIQIEDYCDSCRMQTVDPTSHEQLIYLHALSYKGKDWSFKTEMPIWAQESWTYD